MQASAHEFAEGKNEGIADGIAGERTLFSFADESGFEENSEVFGDISLFHAGGRDQFRYGERTPDQATQKQEAGGFGQDRKVMGRFFDLGIGHEGLGFFGSGHEINLSLFRFIGRWIVDVPLLPR